MNLKAHPIFWSLLFAILTLFLVTIIIAELLQPYIFFSLFIAIPVGIISCLIVLVLGLLLLKK